MYKIDKLGYAYKLTFSDFIAVEEMTNWVNDAKSALGSAPAKFGVFVDMRDLKPLPPDAQAEMQNGQKAFKEKGMERSVVVVNSGITKMQFQRIAKETGIYAWERYVDASSEGNWEQIGIDWISKGVDPDQ